MFFIVFYCSKIHESCLRNEIKDLERQKEILVEEKSKLNRIPVSQQAKGSGKSINGFNNQIYKLDDRLYLLNKDLDELVASREIKKK